MEGFWQTLADDWPATPDLLLVVFRLLLAGLVGALPGLDREHQRMAAGLRTHILVSMGAAIFVLAARDAGVPPAECTRVLQGLATGIGFVGAGAIFRSLETDTTRGLTTAASIWMTAGLGSAVGMGRIWLPLAGSVLAWSVLSVLRHVEHHPKVTVRP